MITNIVDDRTNDKQWKKVYGVVEPTCHDNSIQGADQAPRERLGFCVWSEEPMTLADLLAWASEFEGNNTLYIRNNYAGSIALKVIE